MTSPSAQVLKKCPNDFIFGRVLGEGSFSTVYLAKDIQTEKEFAIKVCEKRHIIREKKQQYVKREKEVLLLLSNHVKLSAPFFVKLFCTFHDDNSLYFVLTRATNGDLLSFLEKSVKFELEVARFYLAELIHAVEHMHMLGIIHRDLKPENILLTYDRHILITDFGSSKILPKPPLAAGGDQNQGTNLRRGSFVGSPPFVSPEMLNEKESSTASDLWAVGCILYQMIEGNPPFQARSDYALFQKILKLEFEYPRDFPTEAKDLISKLLIINPNQRLGAQDSEGYPSIKKHKLFEDMDFENLYLMTPPLPTNLKDMVDCDYKSDHLDEFQDAEPGLGGQQLSRLLGLQLNDENVTISEIPVQTTNTSNAKSTQQLKRTVVNIPENDQQLQVRLQVQQENLSQWHALVDKKLILKQGLVDKRKGLFSRRRMLLLTVGPNLYYVDPSNMVVKGQIPFGMTLRAEAKNFKNFHVHTPGRTYYLEDPEGFALEWCKALEEVRKHYYH